MPGIGPGNLPQRQQKPTINIHSESSLQTNVYGFRVPHAKPNICLPDANGFGVANILHQQNAGKVTAQNNELEIDENVSDKLVGSKQNQSHPSTDIIAYPDKIVISDSDTFTSIDLMRLWLVNNNIQIPQIKPQSY
jgi:hypothetical protein